MDRNIPGFRACRALIRFIGQIRVRDIGLGILGSRQARVRARRRVLRWHVSHLAKVNETINLGYSQGHGYS